MMSADNLKITRRSLVKRTAAFAAGAALGTADVQIASAESHDAEGSRFTGDRISASITKNVVETHCGKVSGYVSGGIVVFKGVPYGSSTEGQNRFMPPAQPKPWTGTRSALHWGWVSPQPFTSTAGGRRAGWSHDDEAFMFQWDDGEPGEDCLRLNVWTPAPDSAKRPVMFWIHGGGFTTGSSNELATYDGENLARRGDVVVVSINHRLGPLGFLNLAEFGDRYAHSANAGVLDLIAALQWVKTNIGNFGGDPGKVLIFGQSGGGGKVSTLMGMPDAQGLFHRAVIQSSGSPLRQLSTDISLQTTAALLKELGVSKAEISKVHSLKPEEILEAALRVSRLARNPGAAQPALGGWGPVVDGKDLPRNVWDPAAPEFSASVPLLVGTVLNEMGNSIQMGSAAFEDMPMDEVRRRLAAQFGNDADTLIAAISKAHTIRKPFDVYAYSQGLPRRTDALTMAHLKAEQATAPAFVYKFAWQSPILDGRSRAYHCSELPFVFYNTERCSSMTGGGPAPMELAGRVSDAWINFARKGDPNHPGLPNWAPFSASSTSTMVFDTASELKADYDRAEVAGARGSSPA